MMTQRVIGDNVVDHESNAHKVFVALPARYEDGLSVLSWALSHFPVDNTKIVITHVLISPFKASPRASFDPKPWLIEKENMVLHLNKYISHCAIYKFRAEKLVHVADNIADGIVQVISQHRTKNLVMRSSTNSGMTDLASETANKVMRKAHLSCKLWFVTGGNLIFTREVYSYKLTSAPISIPEKWPHWNILSTEASSSTFGVSNTKMMEEGNIDELDALLNQMPHEATTEAKSFEEIAEEIDILQTGLAKMLQQNKQEIRELKEILQREKQEMDKWRQDIEELMHKKLLSREFEQVKIENEHFRSPRDESFNQIQVIEEGGHEKKFHLTFNVPSEEQLRKAYASCISTSAGPIMGILYISTAKIAFCSDSPVPYNVGDKTEWMYYKVVIPLDHVKEANPSVSQENEGEKYIQLVCINNHEFWFLGFGNYECAMRAFQQTLKCGVS